MKTLLRTLCAIASCTTALVAAPALAADVEAFLRLKRDWPLFKAQHGLR